MTPKQIRTLRERGLALTRAQFAALLGVHVRTVRRWEGGATQPQDEHVAALNRARKMAETPRAPLASSL